MGLRAGDVIFEVSDPRCLDLSRQQQSYRDILECDKFVEYEENKEFHFVLPDDWYCGYCETESETYLEQQKTCQGRWVTEDRFFGHTGRSCSYLTEPLPANFIKFNNDIFGVLTLRSGYMHLFKRMSGV